MMKYAQITDGTVVNIIDSDTDPDGINGEWIECSNVGVGWRYSGGVFSEQDTTPRHISVGAFFDRFGSAKYPILASTDAGVKALITDCSVRKYIDLDNVQLPYGLDMLIAAGFAIDKTDILTGDIAEGERA